MYDPAMWTDSMASGVLDVGGDRATALTRALGQCMNDLLPGEVLQVISHDIASSQDVEEWCMATGHQLLNARDSGQENWFWIRKRR
jgi:TusA-related sulfurtransferase